MSINGRKSDHLRICERGDVEAGEAGFERIRLKHEALPELDFEEIDLSTKLFGRKLDFPFIIEAMTGGTKEAGEINKDLASVAANFGVAFGVGSQRAAIEDEGLADTFRVRDAAPDALLIANLGAVQLNYGYGVAECRKAVEMIGADALALHINPLQEVIQPEGNKNFGGLAEKINNVAKQLKVPVIAKCVGSGITAETARKLRVDAIDVGGAGGTSWALVEGHRGSEFTRDLAESFKGWGLCTAESVMQVAASGATTIASGGVRSGIDAAKALALGASAVGVALPILKAYAGDGSEGARDYVGQFLTELKVAAFLTGSANVKQLKGKATLLS